MIDETLPLVMPDHVRASRVVARCHARMARQHQRRHQPTPALVERAVVGGFCIVYLSAVLQIALRIHGLL